MAVSLWYRCPPLAVRGIASGISPEKYYGYRRFHILMVGAGLGGDRPGAFIRHYLLASSSSHGESGLIVATTDGRRPAHLLGVSNQNIIKFIYPSS